ncbi:hypothetical protein E2C01_032002 [Portunus trituberculatus]|uniref:Uncharacterized protein n=1 Tax=Portunus trituberculatus TaxID=210409 RepID=A0A5B7EYI2_PORTR|nr:hypothetical protein [Portunus trituberculatus]
MTAKLRCIPNCGAFYSSFLPRRGSAVSGSIGSLRVVKTWQGGGHYGEYKHKDNDEVWPRNALDVRQGSRQRDLNEIYVTLNFYNCARPRCKRCLPGAGKQGAGRLPSPAASTEQQASPSQPAGPPPGKKTCVMVLQNILILLAPPLTTFSETQNLGKTQQPIYCLFMGLEWIFCFLSTTKHEPQAARVTERNRFLVSPLAEGEDDVHYRSVETIPTRHAATTPSGPLVLLPPSILATPDLTPPSPPHSQHLLRAATLPDAPRTASPKPFITS